jgi:tetratricopeptide (TPR) repeat protein
MATVYEAYDTASGGSVALKILRAELYTDSRAHTRMVREAQALGEVDHPAIVRYIDHGVAGGTPFLVMEWVTGETLRAALDSRGLAPTEALRLTRQLASGLAAAHARGVVHRDLKPANVMLAGGSVERATIVDFGVAHLMGALSGVTVTGDQIGTPRYMAPEHIRSSRRVDPKGDVFALGCILFECLTGRPAFDAADPAAILAQILFESIPSPRSLRLDLPDPIDMLVARMMQRDVGRRPTADAVEMRAAELLAGMGPDAQRLGPAPLHGIVGAAPTQTSVPERWDLFGERPPPPSFKLGDNAVLPAARNALPLQSGELIDREDEQRHLVALLGSSNQTVVLWGGPGIGKTRLAVDAVQHLAAQADPLWDALVYADLADARTADDIVRTLATDAAVSLDPSDVPEVALARALDKLGRVLLVVDRVERSAVLLAALLRAFARVAPRLRVLAISRKRWSPPGSVALELGPLPISSPDTTASPAARLLLHRAAQLKSPLSGASRSEESALVEKAERLAAALEGIPLALELAAANLPVLGFEGLLARVFSAPGAPASSLPQVKGPMIRMLEESWGFLTEAERLALARCSVFRGGFMADAAEAVISADGPPGTAIALIGSLRDHSLLCSRDLENGEVRLSMFSAVKEFAQEKLRDRPELPATLRLHAAHFARLFEAGPSRPAERLESGIRHEADNLFAAAEFSISDPEGDLQTGLRVLIALEPAFTLRPSAASGYTDLLDRALTQAAELGDGHPMAAPAMRVRQIRARLDAPSGQAERALRDLDLCLRDAVSRKDAHREGVVWLDLGFVHHLERSWAEARGCYDAALTRLRTADDPSALGRCIGNLGALLHDEGEFAKASSSYRQAIALLESAGETRLRGTFMANLALLEQEVGRSADASRLYDAALSLLEPIRDARLLAIAVGNQGVLELELGRPERAVSLHERSLALWAGSHDVRSRALSLIRLAAALSSMDRAADAQLRLAQANALCETDPVVAEMCALTHGFVDVALAQRSLSEGDRSAARDTLGRARARLERTASAREGSRALREGSDDIRSTMRILETLVERLKYLVG